MQFPMDTWLRWYWPTKGDYFVVTVTCEPAEFLRGLQMRQRQQMLKLGFRLPAPWNSITKLSQDHEDDHTTFTKGDAGKGREGRDRSPRRMSSARVMAAKRLLGLTNVILPAVQEVNEAFASAQRQANTDVFGGNYSSEDNSTGGFGWDMAQLAWARRVLLEAHQVAQEAVADGVLPQWMQEEPIPGVPAPQAAALPLPAP
ncbi:unnamed protein product [Durusdinium trenchii]|uniref:Uncharacterized protein n=1 Tax=Durusdinium trenchii TaxID=1381693 RepID=A0ABP0RKF1_9DINO